MSKSERTTNPSWVLLELSSLHGTPACTNKCTEDMSLEIDQVSNWF